MPAKRKNLIKINIASLLSAKKHTPKIMFSLKFGVFANFTASKDNVGINWEKPRIYKQYELSTYYGVEINEEFNKIWPFILYKNN